MVVGLTGSTGFLGSVVCHELLSRGHEVHALVRNRPEIPVDGVRYFPGDILNQESLLPWIAGCEVVIHCAGQISIHGDMQGKVSKVNIDGTRHVLEAALRAGIRRVVHVSSIHAYDLTGITGVADEQMRPARADAYAYNTSKAEGQRIALEMNKHGLEVLVCNPTALIGPMDTRPSRMGGVILAMVKGTQRFLVRGGFDFCDVRDVSAAIVNAMTKGRPGEAYLLSGKWVTLGALARIVNKVTARRSIVLIFPRICAYAGIPFASVYSRWTRSEQVLTREALAAINDGRFHISSRKAIEALDYQVRPLEETLRDTCAWFIEKGYVKSNT